MMKNIAVLLIVFVPVLIFAEWIGFSDNSGRQFIEPESFCSESTYIYFSLDGFELETTNEFSFEQSSITYKNEGEFLKVDLPSLPMCTSLYTIPTESEVSCNTFLETECSSDITIYLSQELQTESQSAAKQFTIDESFYLGVKTFQQNIIETDEPEIFKDFRIISKTVNSFQYNPVQKERRIVKNVDITLTTTRADGQYFYKFNKENYKKINKMLLLK